VCRVDLELTWATFGHPEEYDGTSSSLLLAIPGATFGHSWATFGHPLTTFGQPLTTFGHPSLLLALMGTRRRHSNPSLPEPP
jgi:hypothetical protein